MDDTWFGHTMYERDLGVSMNHKLNMSQQHDAATNKVNVILDCITRTIGSKVQKWGGLYLPVNVPH